MSEHNDANADYLFPDGNGDKNCPRCRGRGVVPLDLDGWPGAGTENCICVFKRDLLANVARVWPVLLTVESVDDSPLLGLTRQSLWVTASNYTLRRHLRFVAFRMGTQWDARVIGDTSLATAWLSTAKDVKDPDVMKARLDADGEERDIPSNHFRTLVDLAVPFDLLIIQLGAKSAANKEMANVLAEAISERELVGKPTWVVDSPTKPLAPGHLCYNDVVADMLDGFRRVVLPEEHAQALAPTPYGVKPITQEGASGQPPARPRPAPTASPATPPPTAPAASPVSTYTRPKNSMYAPVVPPSPRAAPQPTVIPAGDDELDPLALISDPVDLVPPPPTEGMDEEGVVPGWDYTVKDLTGGIEVPKGGGNPLSKVRKAIEGAS